MTEEYDGHPDLPGIVFAAPGSGKTRRIIAYAIDLLDEGVPGSEIVLVTFTREAGEQLRARLLRETHGTPLETEAKKVFAGTIDSYALNLLHAYDPEARSWDLLGENAPATIVRSLNGRRGNGLDLWDLFPNPPNSHDTTGDKVQRFLEHLQYVYHESRDLDHLRRSNPALARAIQAYWNELEERQRHDFGTVIRRLNALFDQDPEALREENEKYFLVDEAQDLNTNQILLLERLAGDEAKLLVVGDDDQQMYAWRGSDPENLRAAMDRLGATPYVLNLNYRSTEQILEPAAQLIKNNTKRFEKEIRGRGFPGEDGDVTYTEHDSLEDEFYHVLREIQDVVGETYVRPADREDGSGEPHEVRYGDVLVLVRYRSEEALELIRYLRNHNVPVDATNVLNVQKHPFGSLVIDSLRYIINPPSEEPPYGALKTKRNPKTVLRKEYNLGKREIQEFLDRLDQFRERYWEVSEDENDQPWAFAQKIYHAFVRSVIREGFPGELDDEQELILGVISTAVRDFEEVTPRIGGRGLVWLVQTLHDEDGLPNKSPATGEGDAVRVFTVHNAKGLEADMVVMPFATQQAFPLLIPDDPVEWQWDSAMDPPYGNDIEEERNLFYVAMTRARRWLSISCATGEGATPSPFIEEAGLEPQQPPWDGGLAWGSHATSQTRDEGLVTTMSDLRLAHGCRYRYRLANAFGYQPGARTQIGYGGSVHVINQLNLEHIQDEGQVMPQPEYKETIERVSNLPYASGKTEKDLKRGIEDLSLGLWGKWRMMPPKVYDTETDFTIQLDGVTVLEGRSDALVELNGRDPTWNMDLKTKNYSQGDIRLDNPDLEWDILTQQIYHYGLEDVAPAEHGTDLDKSQLYFAQPDEHLEVPTSSSDLEESIEEVEGIADDIKNDELEANPGPQRCKECDFRLVCKYAHPAARTSDESDVSKLVS